MHAQLRSGGNRYSGMVDETVACHTVDKGHLGTHLCGGQIHVRLMDRVASQLEVPFSDEACIALFMLLGKLSYNSTAVA